MAGVEGISRRDLLRASAGAAAGVAFSHAERAPAAEEWPVRRLTDFAEKPAGRGGWGARWRCLGVANLRHSGSEGVLEAGSDVFPNDPRPVAFAVDSRLRDAEIGAVVTRPGSATGVIARRRGPRHYYAAIRDGGRDELQIVRRAGSDFRVLARAALPPGPAPYTLSLRASGAEPTLLVARLIDAAGGRVAISARDELAGLQGAGELGVLTSAETLFPSDRNPVLPALGNVHLLPWGVQEGQAVLQTPVGAAVIGEIRRRSTAGFSRIAIRAPRRPARSRPSVIAATTGAPVPGGARLHVATDLPVEITIELSRSPSFKRSWQVHAGRTDHFRAASKRIGGLEPGRRIWWRPLLRRGRERTIGPARSFLVMPEPGGESPVRVAVASCGSQFGPIFDHLIERDPHAFVWQGDLNYPDTHGPLAQTMSGYAGIWRDFLANPLLEPLLARAAFAAQRDDHDYGIQDANAATIPELPWALQPWESLVNPRTFFRFGAGDAEVWVLDQRRHKSDPEAPDDRDKTLLGSRQRRWLWRTLSASKAAFKIVCSPTTVFMPANERDGNWATSFAAERELLLDHIARRVSGKAIFLTGDTHLTGVYEDERGFEARPAPIGIPTPNDTTLVNPLAAEQLAAEPGVAYADVRCHFAMLAIRRDGNSPSLELELVREDGAVPYRRSF